jgi:hypothetical protein
LSGWGNPVSSACGGFHNPVSNINLSLNKQSSRLQSSLVVVEGEGVYANNYQMKVVWRMVVFSCGKIESLCMVSHNHPVGFNIEACMGCGKILTHHTIAGVEKQCKTKMQLEPQAILWLPQNILCHTKRENNRGKRGLLRATNFNLLD